MIGKGEPVFWPGAVAGRQSSRTEFMKNNHQTVSPFSHSTTSRGGFSIQAARPDRSARGRRPGRANLLVALTCFFSLSVVPSMQAALDTWTGGGANGMWTNVANWGVAAPVNGDDLFFTGVTRLTNTNNIGNLSINSISYGSSGFLHVAISNTAPFGLTITNGIVDPFGGNTNNLPLILGGSQSFSNQSFQATVLGGTINMSNYVLNASSSSGGTLYLNGVISGNGAVGVNTLNVYDGNVRIGAANTFNGGVNINSGTLTLGNAASIPSGDNRGNVLIASGAFLDAGEPEPDHQWIERTGNGR